MCFNRLHIVYIRPYTLRVLNQTHMFYNKHMCLIKHITCFTLEHQCFV